LTVIGDHCLRSAVLGGARIRQPIDLPSGSSSCAISSSFGASCVIAKVAPVKFASGRLILVTRPVLTGSLPTVNTIGIVEVAALAACGELVEPMAMITATCLRTRSAAKAGRRSY
jgi:hypothetical protein